MKPGHFLTLMLLLPLGCSSSPPASDPIIPLNQVPPQILEIARKQLPGFTFETVYRMKVNGKDAYEIRGKNDRGKVREVEVSATGEVLEIE